MNSELLFTSINIRLFAMTNPFGKKTFLANGPFGKNLGRGVLKELFNALTTDNTFDFISSLNRTSRNLNKSLIKF